MLGKGSAISQTRFRGPVKTRPLTAVACIKLNARGVLESKYHWIHSIILITKYSDSLTKTKKIGGKGVELPLSKHATGRQCERKV